MEPLLEHHKQLLAKWRGAMNLVGPGPLLAHYSDSKEGLAVLEEPSGRWADLGTGAGFPGIVFGALYPQATIELVDSRAKRCAFLDRVLATAAEPTDQITVRCTRLERLEDQGYDGLLSRALASPEMMLSHGRRLLKPGGLLVLMLQEDGVIPDGEDFSLLRVHTYTTDGKPRKSALLSWQPADDDD